jgi:hypothetical protein
MESEYTNYDLLDRLIANEKKAKSWTVFWITLLCILAGLLVWLVFSISEKNKTIRDQLDTLERKSDTISDKNALIKSLQDDCAKDKTKMSDSLRTEVATTISALTRIDSSQLTNNGNTINPELQKQKLLVIQNLDKKFTQINKDFQKEKVRIFIQYNDAGDLAQINNLVNVLKNKNDYLVPPPELIKSNFSYRIKCFNYEDAKQESWLQNVMGRNLSVPPDNIKISHETKAGMSPTVEIWIGSPNFVAPRRATLNLHPAQ